MNDIIINNISKSFNGKAVLNNFSAIIPSNKTTCIIGPSGCGKTTLVNMIVGLTRADKGVIENVPKNVSFVFQENRLCNDFSAIENVKLVAKRKNDSTLEAILSAMGVDPNDDKPVKMMSGGEKRRVSIARALSADCELIILDEPFKGLDDETYEAVRNFVREQTLGKTMIIITHDSRDVAYFGENIINMK